MKIYQIYFEGSEVAGITVVKRSFVQAYLAAIEYADLHNATIDSIIGKEEVYDE